MCEKPTIESVSQEIIGNSSGSFTRYESDDFEKLTKDEQIEVENLVSEELEDCSCCGWTFHRDELEFNEHHDVDGDVCWRCASDLNDSAEESDKQDCDHCGDEFALDEVALLNGRFLCGNCEDELSG